jgi:hypothetical protein
MRGNAKPLDQTERRKQLRLVEKELNEDLFVKEIQAPGPEPNEIDEEDRQHNQEQGDDPEEPFQDASKHDGVLPGPALIGQLESTGVERSMLKQALCDFFRRPHRPRGYLIPWRPNYAKAPRPSGPASELVLKAAHSLPATGAPFLSDFF